MAFLKKKGTSTVHRNRMGRFAKSKQGKEIKKGWPHGGAIAHSLSARKKG